MKTGLVLIAISVCLLGGVGCGSSGSSTRDEATQHLTAAQVKKHRHHRHQAKKQREVARHKARIRARKQAAHRRARRHHRIEVRQEHREEVAAQRVALIEEREQRQAEKAEAAEAPAEEDSECDPNYEGACLDPNASDYDCEGGSGNGPDYTGEVTVVGEDHYGLDADGDGIGCEPE
jgi:hypothetical protein